MEIGAVAFYFSVALYRLWFAYGDKRMDEMEIHRRSKT